MRKRVRDEEKEKREDYLRTSVGVIKQIGDIILRTETSNFQKLPLYCKTALVKQKNRRDKKYKYLISIGRCAVVLGEALGTRDARWNCIKFNLLIYIADMLYIFIYK